MPHGDDRESCGVVEVTCALCRAANRWPVEGDRFDGGEKYVKGTERLEADDIEFCLTISYTPEGNNFVERLNRTVNNVIRAI